MSKKKSLFILLIGAAGVALGTWWYFRLALKPGMTANSFIITAHRDDVLKIPLAALRFHPPVARANGRRGRPVTTHQQEKSQAASGSSGREQRRVWVQADGQELQPVLVQIGLSDDTHAELLSANLTEGARVITGIQTASSTDVRQTTVPGFGMGAGRRPRR